MQTYVPVHTFELFPVDWAAHFFPLNISPFMEKVGHLFGLMIHFVCYLLEASRTREGGGGGTSPKAKAKKKEIYCCVHLCPPYHGQGLKQACAGGEGGSPPSGHSQRPGGRV